MDGEKVVPALHDIAAVLKIPKKNLGFPQA